MCNYACLGIVPKSTPVKFILRPQEMFITGVAYEYSAPYDKAILSPYLDEK